MTRLVLAALAALPLVAGAQEGFGAFSGGFNDFSAGAFSTPSTSLALHLPLDRWGGLIAEDAGTVAHVYWNGTALVDTKGNAWTQVGTVPQGVATPLYPDGFTQPQRKGAGPFSDANYYQLGSGSDPLDFAGDFTVCVAYHIVANPAVIQVMVGNGTSASGYYFAVNSDGGARALFGGGAAVGLQAANLSVPGAVNVACMGRAGATGYVKLNLGATATGAVPATSGAGSPLYVGRYASGGSAFAGTLIEVYATTTPWDETKVTEIQRRFFGMVGTKGEPITVARSSTATYTTPDGRVWTAPPNVLRIGCEDAAATKCGALIEPTRTNLALQSGDLSNAAWTKTNVTVTTDGTKAPDGSLAWKITEDATTGQHVLFSGALAGAGSTTYQCSWYVKAGSLSTPTLHIRTDAAAWSLAAFDLAAGTVTSGTGTISPALVDGWRRITVSGTTVAGYATPNVALYVTTTASYLGTGRFLYASSPQCEAGGYANSYIPTAGTSVQRSADVVSVANPLTDPSQWCVEGTYATESGRTWGNSDGFPGLWLIGSSYAGANVAAMFAYGTFDIRDGTGGGVAKTMTGLSAFMTNGATHRFQASAPSGEQVVKVDGLARVGTVSGAGTGIMTAMPATIMVGLANAANYQFGGYVRGFKVYRRASCR